MQKNLEYINELKLDEIMVIENEFWEILNSKNESFDLKRNLIDLLSIKGYFGRLN